MRPREAVEVEGIEVNDPFGSDPDGMGVSRAEPIRSCFDLPSMVSSIADRFADAASDKGLSLQVKAADALPLQVFGDERSLDFALSALVDNAVKFTDQGEVVASITCENGHGSRVVMHVEVSDTGQGIATEVLERLFDNTRRNGVSTVAGAGGLLQSQRLVEFLDGRFGCCSEVGTGTTVWFTVPLDLPA